MRHPSRRLAPGLSATLFPNKGFEPYCPKGPENDTNQPTKWHVRPAKTQISLGIRSAWSESSLSAWRKLGSLATNWLSVQRRLWSDWADAQADLSFRWAHMPFCWFCQEAAHNVNSWLTKSTSRSYPPISTPWHRTVSSQYVTPFWYIITVTREGTATPISVDSRFWRTGWNEQN